MCIGFLQLLSSFNLINLFLISESAEEEEEPLNPGSRFSKSPTERERILYVRKEKLLLGARRRYLERLQASPSS